MKSKGITTDISKIFREVAEKYGTSEEEILTMYNAVWISIYSYFNSPCKMKKAYIKNWGKFRPHKKIRNILNDMESENFTKEELYALV